jgi:hypothetical protein
MNTSKCSLTHLPLYTVANTLVMSARKPASCSVYTLLMRSPRIIMQGMHFMFCYVWCHKLCNVCIRKLLYGGRNPGRFPVFVNIEAGYCDVKIEKWDTSSLASSETKYRTCLVIAVSTFIILSDKFECLRQSKSIITFTTAGSVKLTARTFSKHSLDLEKEQPSWKKVAWNEQPVVIWRYRRPGNIFASWAVTISEEGPLFHGVYISYRILLRYLQQGEWDGKYMEHEWR